MKLKEKTDVNKNFTKLTQKKGISLIVLIITIIVIIILAAVVILNISKNNPVESAKEARFKEDVRSFQEDLSLSISKDYTAKAGQRNDKFNAKTFDEIKNNYELKGEKFASMACRAAIKANDKIHKLEIDNLISQLNRCENPFTCPHGRPIVVEISKKEIEKMFKRIM